MKFSAVVISAAGEFWEDGYFARTVGDKVTAEVIKKYIRFHNEQVKRPEQLHLL